MWVRLRRFETRRLGSRIRIPKDAFQEWLNAQEVMRIAEGSEADTPETSSTDKDKIIGNAAFRKIFRPWLLAPEQIAHLKARALRDDAVFIRIVDKCFSTPATVRPENEGGAQVVVAFGTMPGGLNLAYAPKPELPPAKAEPQPVVESLAGKAGE